MGWQRENERKKVEMFFPTIWKNLQYDQQPPFKESFGSGELSPPLKPTSLQN